jgi:hypothetical protein
MIRRKAETEAATAVAGAPADPAGLEGRPDVNVIKMFFFVAITQPK